MKEFIEKLIEKLEKLNAGGIKMIEDGKYELIRKKEAIQIVNELAEEFATDINVVSNNGWIPCSERLPSKEEYQKSNGQFIVSDGNRTYATYFDIYDTLKFGVPTIDHFKVDKCVIAWQPLPQPYKENENGKI